MLKKKEPQVVSSPPKDLYYMKQTISNACGTVAMMHAIANNKAKYDLDSEACTPRETIFLFPLSQS